MSTIPSLQISDMGERAVLCQLPPAPLSLAAQERFWALSDALAVIDGVEEVIPGMNNLLVGFDIETLSRDALTARLQTAWLTIRPQSRDGKVLKIPVRYGGRDGEDLAALAEAKGMTVDAFARLHAAGDYIVYALGSQPGFGYLGGLDPRLAMPRRNVPRASVKAGAVIIGGNQTAVQSRTSPSGWHMIGQTDQEFFNAEHNPPALLMPGDRVRFVIEEILS